MELEDAIAKVVECGFTVEHPTKGKKLYKSALEYGVQEADGGCHHYDYPAEAARVFLEFLPAPEDEGAQYVKQIHNSRQVSVRQACSKPLFNHYVLGWAAGMRGEEREDCPYASPESPEGQRWQDGYCDAGGEP